MRALCTVRGPLPAAGATAAEARGTLAAGARLLALRAPGLSHPLHFVVEAKSRVRDLRARAQQHFQLQGIADADLFGLAVFTDGEYLFVDLDSKLSKYAPKSWRSSHTHGLDANGRPLLELHFTVQFYVESPLLLSDEAARRLYFLQLRANILARDVLPPERLLPLAGLALQADHGDADQYADLNYFRLSDIAPRSFSGDWVAAAARSCHREHRGLTRSAAEARFIREVSLLPHTIDAHRYTMKRNKAEAEPGGARLFVTARGINLSDDDVLPHKAFFPWSSIAKLSFDRKKFEIRTREGNVTLHSGSEDKVKSLFALCRETHQFSLKIAAESTDILREEEELRKNCFGYSDTLFECDKKKSEQRVSVISSASSNTTSGIVSDRVHSEDELEIMIDSPPAISTESLALAHLLDGATVGHSIDDTPMQSRREVSNSPNSKAFREPEPASSERHSDSPVSNKLKCAGSQCSSSCSTVVIARAGLTARRTSNASSLELGFSHTAQNSTVSERNVIGDVEYTATSVLYDGPLTVAASSETSGVYTMGGSETTTNTRKADTISEVSRTECGSSHYSFDMSHELARFDSVSSIVDSAIAERKSPVSDTSIFRLQNVCDPSDADCVDGRDMFGNEEAFRQRTGSSASAASFHGDGSDPTDGKRTLLSASELSDLIVGRGVYPARQSVSDTLDSVSDYVRLPLSGESYLPGHEDTAPSDDTYRDAFFERPPTPPSRIDSCKLNLSLPNILDLDEMSFSGPAFPAKPPPPYEFDHDTFSPETRARDSTSNHARNRHLASAVKYDCEEVAARVVTSKPMITILKAEAGEVPSTIERTFAGPVSVERRFEKSKRQVWMRAATPARENKDCTAESVLVTMLKLPPPPPPRSSRLPPPPPPPPHLQQFHRQLYSDVDFVMYPFQDPLISQQNYLDSKLAGRHSSALHYRSAPYLASPQVGSAYGSTQNLSDSYVQLPRPPRGDSEERLTSPPDAPSVRLRRVPPPPPPPYRRRADPPNLRDSKKECTIDIKTLREKSKNLDLPLIAALCNDRSLLKQTKAFGPGRPEDCNAAKKSVTTDSVEFRCKRESNVKPSQHSQGKRILVRNPNDKLPELPGEAPTRPRALSNTYVAHPGAAH